MTHLPASPPSKQLGKAARVPCAYKRGPNLIAGYLHGGGDALLRILKRLFTRSLVLGVA